MIQENVSELSIINESISVDTMEELERVLKAAYEQGRNSYSPGQRVIGIPGKTEDRPVDQDPHVEVVNALTSLVRSTLDDMGDDESGQEKDLAWWDIRDARRALPDDSTFKDLADHLGVSVSRLQKITDDINQGYEDRFIEDQDWGDDDDYPKILGYTDPETGEKVMINVSSEDDMDDILTPLLRQHPDLKYSID